MSKTWLQALKEFNNGKDKWTIPKKGTKDYLQVKKLMGQSGAGMGHSKAKKGKKLPKNEFDSVSLEDSFDYPTSDKPRRQSTVSARPQGPIYPSAVDTFVPSDSSSSIRFTTKTSTTKTARTPTASTKSMPSNKPKSSTKSTKQKGQGITAPRTARRRPARQ